MDDIKKQIDKIGRKAKEVSRFLASASSDVKNEALHAMAYALRKETGKILDANRLDVEEGQKNGISSALLDRLSLSKDRIEVMALGIEEIATFKDPIGSVDSMWVAEKGLRIGRMRVPLGVVAIVYESRPNVAADAAALCLKAGNAVILRGGKEAKHSNAAIASVLVDGAAGAGVPKGAVQNIENINREATYALMEMTEYVDVLIPRGGSALKKAVQERARVPYIMTGMGNCHVFVDASADLEKALAIIINAKTQRPSVCNAAEKLLVHEKIAPTFLPLALERLTALGVEIRGDERTKILFPDALSATEEDWETEYLDFVLAVKIVLGVDEAVAHISRYGTGHSEAIITESYTNAQRFLREVDAAAVYANASTRFTDGGVFGFGAEMGISTQKLHARGPMGVEQLTSIKYVIYGDGQVR